MDFDQWLTETDWSTSKIQVTGNARFPQQRNDFPAPHLGAIHKKTSHTMSLYYRASILLTFIHIYHLIQEKSDDFHATPKILWLFGGHTGNHVVSAAVPTTPRGRCFFLQYPLGGVGMKVRLSTSGENISRQKSQREMLLQQLHVGGKRWGWTFFSPDSINDILFIWYSAKSHSFTN